MAFRSGGSLFRIFKKMKTGGGGAEGAAGKLNVELNVCCSRPKGKMFITVHPDDAEVVSKLIGTKESSWLDKLSIANLFAATGDMALKTGRFVLKGKESGFEVAAKDVLKGEVCHFGNDNLTMLSVIYETSQNNLKVVEGLKEVLREVMEQLLLSKKGSPPPASVTSPPAKGKNGGPPPTVHSAPEASPPTLKNGTPPPPAASPPRVNGNGAGNGSSVPDGPGNNGSSMPDPFDIEF